LSGERLTQKAKSLFVSSWSITFVAELLKSLPHRDEKWARYVMVFQQMSIRI
jgi:hypothetical protein